ncbi:MAG TPA: ABC transporter permease [Steroidobacteraceae bacterium]|nr:ABC transporter permease [Steroidobacteraceae bacterium]HNS28455.1 ABC transporter permease [Steroidobacteraceae bacterium]
MKKRALFSIALRSILRNKMRTLLTMLGIVIGVAAVIVMVALGQGAQATIEAQIKGLGTNMLVIMAGSTTQGGVSQGAATFNRLTIADYEKLAREGTLLAAVSPVIFSRGQVIGGGTNWRASIMGVAPTYQQIRDWPAQSGSFFTEADTRSVRRVVVLGSTVANALFADSDPVGQQIQLRNVPFTVIGVLSAKGQTAGGSDQDDTVIIPYTTAQAHLAGRSFIGQIIANTFSPGDVPAAQEEIRSIMREAHKIAPGDADDFTIRNQDEIAAAASGTTRVMSMLLAAIASISLVVGGIGIMNIMLVSVTERTREIGIRMAIGARSSDVLAQFLVESIVISLAGGLIGIVLGYGSSILLARLTGWAVAMPPEAALIAVAFSAAVGVFFGFYPARKASALDPIQALRYE